MDSLDMQAYFNKLYPNKKTNNHRKEVLQYLQQQQELVTRESVIQEREAKRQAALAKRKQSKVKDNEQEENT